MIRHHFIAPIIIGLASFASPASFAAPAPPLRVAQQDAVPTDTTDAEEDNNWRLNLDLYGFAPLSADTDVTLNGNSDTLSWDLRDVLDHLTGLMTVRAGLEKGRWGLQTALNYSRFAGDFGGSSWTSLDRSRNRRLTGNEVNRRLTLRGDLDGDFQLEQAMVDVALRYRAGAVQRPRMEPGEATFVGFAGARIVGGTISGDVDVKLASSYEGPILESERSKTQSFDSAWSHTWVQPLIGMHANYTLSDDWQAFLYLDAAGFGLSGREDLSGIAQAGIAYTIGNSTQLSLSYKYCGLNYLADGSDNGYDAKQHGLNVGLRILFE